jgi:opacity protein-like surface antigen
MKRTLKTKISLLLATTLLATGPALAQSANWTGAYLGGEIGGAHFKASSPTVSDNNDDVIGGIIAGYDYDLGTWVIGAGADIDFTDNTLSLAPNNPLDRVWRLKLRGGVKIGNGLAYAVGGYTEAHIDNLGSDDGYFIGGGYEHQIMPNFSVAGEVLYHDINNFKSTGTDVEITSYQIRGVFRF